METFINTKVSNENNFNLSLDVLIRFRKDLDFHMGSLSLLFK
jgi:hypothetical protein